MIRTKHKQTLVRTGKPGPKGMFQESMIDEVYQLARFGLTNEEIAEFYHFSISTLENYQRKYPNFNKNLQRGRMVDSLKVVASLHKQALGYDVTEKEYSEHLDRWGNVHVLEKTTHKHITPSVTAAIYLLKTRHGDKWADIVKSENTQNYNLHVKHNIDLSNMDTNELIMLEQLGMKITTSKSGQKQLAESFERN